MDTNLAEHVQKSTTSALITLFEMYLEHMDLGIVRFTSGNVDTQTSVVFNGETYYAWPIEADGFERNAQGSAERPTLRVAAIYPEMVAILMSGKLQGSLVKRIRTFRDFLDDGVDPSPTSTLPIDIYRVECIKEWDSTSHAVIELANPLDIENAHFPKRQIIRDYCYWRYRTYDSIKDAFVYSGVSPCPYAGENCFNRLNESVTDPSLDQCPHTLEGCKKRFGEHGILPFGGFPGVARASSYV